MWVCFCDWVFPHLLNIGAKKRESRKGVISLWNVFWWTPSNRCHNASIVPDKTCISLFLSACPKFSYMGSGWFDHLQVNAVGQFFYVAHMQRAQQPWVVKFALSENENTLPSPACSNMTPINSKLLKTARGFTQLNPTFEVIAYLFACLPTFPPNYLPICNSNDIPMYLSCLILAYLSVLSMYLTYCPADLPECLFIYLSIYLY